jgi:superfamily II DNA helicase RecQ
VALLAEASGTTIDNKEVKKRFDSLLERIGKELRVKLSTLAAARGPFTVRSYLEAKGAAIAELESGAKIKTPKAGKVSKTDKVRSAEQGVHSTDGTTSDDRFGPHVAGDDGNDILNPDLFELLREWRYKLSREQGVPAYVVATQKALIGIANTLPSTAAGLGKIKGIGKVFIEKYGAQVLSIVEDYRAGNVG